VELAAGERRLEQVRGVHRAFRLARADEGVHLVDEQDHLAGGVLDLGENGLQALLELAAEFRASHEGAEVESEHPLALQRLRNVAVDDPEREPLDDRRLAHPRFADQHRVVLGPPREHLDDAPDLLVAPDHRVELALAGSSGDVAGIFGERVERLLRALACHLASLADVGDRAFERLRRGAGPAQRRPRRPVRVGKRDQKPVLRHELVACLLRRLLRGVEHPHELRREHRLAGARARHLRQPRQRTVDRGTRLGRVAPGGADQPGGGTVRVVEQGLEQVLGQDPLMVFADGDGGCGLQEAAGAFGELLDVHVSVPLRGDGHRVPPKAAPGGSARCSERC